MNKLYPYMAMLVLAVFISVFAKYLTGTQSVLLGHSIILSIVVGLLNGLLASKISKMRSKNANALKISLISFFNLFLLLHVLEVFFLFIGLPIAQKHTLANLFFEGAKPALIKALMISPVFFICTKLFQLFLANKNN